MEKAGERTDAQWREQLSPAEYDVLRKAGTERAFTGEYTDNDRPACTCSRCGNELFRSDTKFDSRLRLAVFYSGRSRDNAVERVDRPGRTEARPRRCARGATRHLGHVFAGEGYGTPTDQR